MPEQTHSYRTHSGRELRTERRAFPRQECNLQATCRAFGDATAFTWPSVLRDISEGGVGLVVPRQVRRGLLLTLRLENQRQTRAFVKVARVIHVRPEGEGSSFIGCAFVKRLDEDEVEQLLG